MAVCSLFFGIFCINLPSTTDNNRQGDYRETESIFSKEKSLHDLCRALFPMRIFTARAMDIVLGRRFQWHSQHHLQPQQLVERSQGEHRECLGRWNRSEEHTSEL